MRELKFRAWHKRRKEMCPVRGLTELAVMQAHDPTIGKAIILRDGLLRTPAEFGKKDSPLILMQFTGLFDNNGLEIYRGDIVKYYDSTTMWLEGEVIWLGGGWGIETLENPIALYDFVHDYLYDGKPLPRLEVIGNVWENKDLING